MKTFFAPTFFLVIAICYLIFSYSHTFAHFGGDNAFYFMMMKSFSPFTGANDIEQYFSINSQYPPLYPLLASYLGGSINIAYAHLITTLFLLFSYPLIIGILKTEGLPTFAANLAAILFFLLPGTYLHTLSLNSENLYILTSLILIYSCIKFEKKENAKHFIVIIISVAATCLTRTAGYSLMIATIIYLLIHNRKYCLYFSIIFSPVLLWQLLKETNNNASYSRSFFESYSQLNYLELTSSLKHQFFSLVQGWNTNFTYSLTINYIKIAFGIICLAGATQRLLNKKLDAIYVFIYLLMVVVWPFPAEATRLIFALLPVMLIQGILFTNDISVAIYKKKASLFVCATLSLLYIIVAPDLILNIKRYNTKTPPGLEPYVHTNAWFLPNKKNASDQIALMDSVIYAMQELNQFIPEGQCVYSIKPPIISLYANRISKRVPEHIFQTNKTSDFKKHIDCEYFFMISYTSPSFPQTLYPLELIKSEISIIKLYFLDENNSKLAALLGKVDKSL